MLPVAQSVEWSVGKVDIAFPRVSDPHTLSSGVQLPTEWVCTKPPLSQT